jgi:hypothetical protein
MDGLSASLSLLVYPLLPLPKVPLAPHSAASTNPVYSSGSLVYISAFSDYEATFYL